MPWRSFNPFPAYSLKNRPPFFSVAPSPALFLRLILIPLFFLLGGTEVRSEIYSIQIGSFQQQKNARRMFDAIRKTYPVRMQESLRIEKNGDQFTLRVGRFPERTEAEDLLAQWKRTFPMAFIWRGSGDEKNIVYSTPPGGEAGGLAPGAPSRAREPLGGPGSETIRTGKVLGPADPVSRPEKTGPPVVLDYQNPPPADTGLRPNLAVLIGTVLETTPFPAHQLGWAADKELVRLTVQVEETENLEGFANYLREKKGETLTIFTETRTAPWVPGRKMKALVEYRGDQFRRYFWIKKAEPLAP